VRVLQGISRTVSVTREAAEIDNSCAGAARYFQDRNITNFIWWTWNANGGDTGGLTTPEQDMWKPNKDPNNPDHIVLPRDPPDGTPWTDVRARPRDFEQPCVPGRRFWRRCRPLTAGVLFGVVGGGARQQRPAVEGG
jgi:hypothetical protein